MPFAIDHVVVAVNDLNQAIADYEELGFTVTPGGDHAHRGSHNALITFQDGSYIELIAFKHEPPVKDNTWWDLLQLGEGLVDVAVLSANLPEEVDRLAAAGHDITGPMQGGRHRPDGIEIAWRVARIDTGAENRLPFVIDDLTDHDLRVPAGEAAEHPNGTTGIGAVVFAVTSREAVRPAWTTLCGDPTDGDTFHVGVQTIRIADAETLDDTSAQWLASRGSGPVEVMLRGTDRDLPTQLTHNAHFTRFGQQAND
jgi:hypothetical protein